MLLRGALVRGRLLFAVSVLVLVLGALPASAADHDLTTSSYDPVIASMLADLDEDALYWTTYDLQNFTTRSFGTRGNLEAATYIHDRLAAIDGLEVAFTDGDYRNVIATLPGTGAASEETIVVGAHYDSDSYDRDHAPGATDNGCGVAIVLELARIMSEHRYGKTIVFAFWNAEEDGMQGSRAYAINASDSGRAIPYYLNYDAAYYDPDDEFVLDITHDDASLPLAEAMSEANAAYGIGLALTFNENPGSSDHTSFRDVGYPILDLYILDTYEQYHTPEDTVEIVSLPYARRIGNLGLALLAETAGLSDAADILIVPGGSDVPRDLDGDGTCEDVNGNGRKDFADLTLYFNRMIWIGANEPLAAFDYNDNGRIDFADLTWLFEGI
jgi:PKD repeat protein